MRALPPACLLALVVAVPARAAFVAESAFATASRTSTFYNNPRGPDYRVGDTTGDPTLGVLAVDLRGQGAFGDAALKFSLAGIASVQSATLSLTARTSAVQDAPVALSGFAAGSGSIGLADFDRGTALGIRSVAGSTFATTALAYDVTAFLNALIGGGSAAAGFQLDGSSAAVVVNGNGDPVPGERPVLSIVYTPAAVPEPGSLVLLAGGLVGVALAARQPRRERIAKRPAGWPAGWPGYTAPPARSPIRSRA